jgi:putative transposase
VVVRTLGFCVLRRILGVVGGGQTADAKDAEIAVLRHKLAVLRRQVAAPCSTPAGRTVLARLASRSRHHAKARYSVLVALTV